MFYKPKPLAYTLILDNSVYASGQKTHRKYIIGYLKRKDIEFIKENIDDILFIMNNKLLQKERTKINTLKCRYYRVKKQFYQFVYINLMLGKNLYFATFTFDNEHLSFDRVSFRKYLQRTCKLNYCLFCDFGEISNRFHLHGFVACDYLLNNSMCNKFGFVKFANMNFTKRNLKKSIDYSIEYSMNLTTNFTILKTYSNFKKGIQQVDLNNFKKVVDLFL